MAKDINSNSAGRIASITKRIGIYLLIISVLSFLFSMIVPIESNSISARTSNKMLSSMKESQPPKMEELLRKVSDRRLIRPAQIQAAVKDNGVAEKMAKNLKLRGVVQLGKDMVAYVEVGKFGVKSVHSGEKVLEFVVEDIQPGLVTLSLNGVNVVLRN